MGNKKKDELLDLAQSQINATQDADMAALDAQTERDMADSMETETLDLSHKAEASGLADYNKSVNANMAQIITDIEGTIDAAKKKDEVARKRENAFRYISGLGDTLSGVANLIGTAHYAANQNQKYNSSAVVQKAEEARKARKLEMDDLSKRLDEMKARQRDLQAAGSLKEVELKARQDKEKAALAAGQRKAAEDAKKYADTQAYRAHRDATEDWQKERAFNAQQAQFNKTFNLRLREFNHKTDGDDYNFTFADGSVDVPKKKVNEANIERIFKMLPEDIRSGIKGEQYVDYETDEMGNQTRKISFKAPSLNQKIAAIAAYADSNEEVKNEIKRLAGMSVKPSSQEETPADNPAPTTDWSGYKVGGTTAPAAAPAAASAMGTMWEQGRAMRKEQKAANAAARAASYPGAKEEGKKYMPTALSTINNY